MTANLRPLLTLALIPIGAATLCGYAFDNPGNISVFLKWPDGQVVMHEQLGPGSGTLMDGSTGWNEAFEPALAAWNQAMTRLQFRPVRDSTAPIGFDNEVNNIIFASDAFGGYSFDDAPSLSFVYYAYSVIFESDIVLNRKYVWNSYRGKLRPGVMEIRRVALHDAGGALGLDSPDHYGQMVASIMNSEIGDIDALQADDITGAQALYGAPPGTPIDYGTVPFPPRGEVVAFENQLENY